LCISCGNDGGVLSSGNRSKDVVLYNDFLLKICFIQMY